MLRINAFHTPVIVKTPIYTNVLGVLEKEYKILDTIYCSWNAYGGTEKIVNNLLVVEDTAIVITWYRPDITSDCIIELNGQEYEIISSVENVDMMYQYCKFKVRLIAGGA